MHPMPIWYLPQVTLGELAQRRLRFLTKAEKSLLQIVRGELKRRKLDGALQNQSRDEDYFQEYLKNPKSIVLFDVHVVFKDKGNSIEIIDFEFLYSEPDPPHTPRGQRQGGIIIIYLIDDICVYINLVISDRAIEYIREKPPRNIRSRRSMVVTESMQEDTSMWTTLTTASAQGALEYLTVVMTVGAPMPPRTCMNQHTAGNDSESNFLRLEERDPNELLC